ncbi:MAG: hypothetical protein JHC98_00790 [Thermoleophilaceae bacterium]|nr:hypothetical protein [Thermoleophilaceae bacterium]
MLRPFARSVAAVSLAGALMLGATSVTQSATTKFDTSYQNAGTLQLPTIKGVYGQVAQSCEISGRSLNIAGRFGYSQPGLPGPWTTEQQLATASIKVRPRQKMMLGIAEVNWRKQRIPTDQIVLGNDFDSQGGFAYVTRSQRKSLRAKLKLFRVLPSGRRDPKFGTRGFISITIAGFDQSRPAGFRVIALAGGKVVVLAQTSDTQVLLKYAKDGKPDASWGNKGVVELAAPKAYTATPLNALDSATVTSDGGMLISASSLPGKPAGSALGVLKLGASGKPDSKWAGDGLWTPPAAGKPKRITSAYTITGQSLMTTIRKNGDYAILYADGASVDTGTYSELKLAYVDEDSGVTTLFNEEAGLYFNGGDGGFPDAQPWILRESSAGTVFAHADSFYDSPGGTFLGHAARFSADADVQVNDQDISNSGFATGAFAVDPAAKYLYFCGSLGVTSVKTKDARKREQRKTVAVRRIKLF